MKKKAYTYAQEEIKKAKIEADEKSTKDNMELENLRMRDAAARTREIEYLKQSQEIENIRKNQMLELEKAKIEERKKVEEEAKK
jgi:hypothetical protein